MKDAQLEEDLQALAKAFLLLKTEEECTAFLKDVCTYQELRALSQRLHVARLLRKQYVFHEIVQETGASTATISRVNRTLRNRKRTPNQNPKTEFTRKRFSSDMEENRFCLSVIASV